MPCTPDRAEHHACPESAVAFEQSWNRETGPAELFKKSGAEPNGEAGEHEAVEIFGSYWSHRIDWAGAGREHGGDERTGKSREDKCGQRKRDRRGEQRNDVGRGGYTPFQQPRAVIAKSGCARSERGQYDAGN